MGTGKHGKNGLPFRRLPDYQSRVKAFNATLNKCREYFRVMAELDLRTTRSMQDIARARIATLEKEIAAIRQAAGL